MGTNPTTETTTTVADRFEARWSRLPRALRVLILLALLLLFVPWVAVQALPASWAFIFGAWAATFFFLTFRKPRGQRSALLFNVGFLCLALAGVEVFLELQEPPRVRYEPRRHDAGYTERHPDLGYAPIPDNRARIKRFVEEEPIFDVSYGIDALGRRVGRPAAEGAEKVVFFGCSFTYGEGLEDDETFPYLVGELSEGRIEALNLAFSGYGPHQMLAMLESGRADVAAEVSDGVPTHAFFLALTHHATRVAGRAAWDRYGPRYELEPDGSVTRDGQFRKPSPVVYRVRKWLHASNLYRLVDRRREATDHEIALMAGIVAAAKSHVESGWPGCRFHVLLWGGPSESETRRTLDALEGRGLTVHLVTDALPGYAEDRGRYRIHRRDAHPNARATRAVAGWIVNDLLGDDPDAAPSTRSD